MSASTCDTVSRLCVRPECCWFAFPLVPALGSTGSAADRSALFASFAATTAGSDFPRSFIIGYRFSLPDADQKRDCPGRTRDLPSSDAILLRVICSSTPAGRAWPRLAALSMLRSTLCTVSAPATYPLRGSITHPTQPLCTLRGRRRRRLTQHSLPGCLLSITWVGLSPTDRASFAWRLRRVGPRRDIPQVQKRAKSTCDRPVKYMRLAMTTSGSANRSPRLLGHVAKLDPGRHDWHQLSARREKEIQ